MAWISPRGGALSDAAIAEVDTDTLMAMYAAENAGEHMPWPGGATSYAWQIGYLNPAHGTQAEGDPLVTNPQTPELTPAVERTEAAIYEIVWGGPRDEDRAPDEDELSDARKVLAAALDVEDMARALYASDVEANRYGFLGPGQTAPEYDDLIPADKEGYEAQARFLIIHLLGEVAL